MYKSRGVISALLVVVGLLGGVNLASAKPYKAAEIYSKQTYKYGRYEMRMQVAKGSGVLSTFFTYKNGSEQPGVFWEEIDIEIFGKNNATQWQSNVIIGTNRPTTKTEGVHTMPYSLGDGYHTYVLEWTPTYIAWFVDGTQVRRINGGQFVTGLTNVVLDWPLLAAVSHTGGAAALVVLFTGALAQTRSLPAVVAAPMHLSRSVR